MSERRKYRRVVTGVTTDGKSTVVSDTTIPVADVLGMVDFWFTDQVPASLTAQGQPEDQPIRLEPPRSGTNFRLFEIPAQPEGLTPGEGPRQAAHPEMTSPDSSARILPSPGASPRRGPRR